MENVFTFQGHVNKTTLAGINALDGVSRYTWDMTAKQVFYSPLCFTSTILWSDSFLGWKALRGY